MSLLPLLEEALAAALDAPSAPPLDAPLAEPMWTTSLISVPSVHDEDDNIVYVQRLIS